MMTPMKFWQTAASWGSFMTNNDPGACMYGFDVDGLPQNESHRQECLEYIEDLKKNLKASSPEKQNELMTELSSMTEYLQVANTLEQDPELNDFERAYVEAMLFSSIDEYEEPFDSNYTFRHLSPEALSVVKSDCEKFVEMAGDMISTDRLAQAGHDFWLTRNGHGAGFWDGKWEEPAASKLTELSKQFGENDLYANDEGKIDFSCGAFADSLKTISNSPSI